MSSTGKAAFQTLSWQQVRTHSHQLYSTLTSIPRQHPSRGAHSFVLLAQACPVGPLGTEQISVFLGHIQKGFSPFSHHELSSGDRDLLQFLKNERRLICLHLHLLQGQPSGSDVLFPFTQQHVQMQFKKWSKRNFQEPVFCLKMRYDSCYSETFFTFYAQVMITLKLLPEYLCLGQSTILWTPFMWEYHCKAMNSLLETGA